LEDKLVTKKKITKDDANRYAIQYGYFYGLERMKLDFEVTSEQEKGMRGELFKHVLVKVLEAKKEVAKLQASVARLESACRAGAAGVENQLMLELQPFDGWVISLLETNVSLLATVHNPETAGIRVNGLKAAFADLWNKRMTTGYGPYDNYPDIFRSTMAIFVR
jgi:hypothetical protein